MSNSELAIVIVGGSVGVGVWIDRSVCLHLYWFFLPLGCHHHFVLPNNNHVTITVIPLWIVCIQATKKNFPKKIYWLKFHSIDQDKRN